MLLAWFVILACAYIYSTQESSHWWVDVLVTKASLWGFTGLFDCIYLFWLHIPQICIKKIDHCYHILAFGLACLAYSSTYVNCENIYKERGTTFPWALMFTIIGIDIISPPIRYMMILTINCWWCRDTEYTFEDYAKHQYHYPHGSDLWKFWFIPEAWLFIAKRVDWFITPNEECLPDIIRNPTIYGHPAVQWIPEKEKTYFESLNGRYLRRYEELRTSIATKENHIEIPVVAEMQVSDTDSFHPEAGANTAVVTQIRSAGANSCVVSNISYASVPVSSAPSHPLPPGWEAKVDTMSGKLYYVDHNSQRSIWDRWEEKVDPDTGRTYWVDHICKNSTWTNPYSTINE